MIKVRELFFDVDDEVWAFVCEEDRYCYVLVTDIIDSLTHIDKQLDEKLVETYLNHVKLTIVDKPHIEDVNPITRFMWNEITTSENCMYFLDDDELEYITDKFNITKEEVIKQVDNDIEKYNLYDVVEKGGDCIYTCYGKFMESFTGKTIDNTF